MSSNKMWEALCLLRSMVLSGEAWSEASEVVFNEALASLSQQPKSQEPVYYCRQDAIDNIGGAHVMHHKPVSEFNVPLYAYPQQLESEPLSFFDWLNGLHKEDREEVGHVVDRPPEAVRNLYQSYLDRFPRSQPESEPDDAVIERIRQWHWENRGCQLCPEDYRDVFELVRRHASPQPSQQSEGEPDVWLFQDRTWTEIAAMGRDHNGVAAFLHPRPSPREVSAFDNVLNAILSLIDQDTSRDDELMIRRAWDKARVAMLTAAPSVAASQVREYLERAQVPGKANLYCLKPAEIDAMLTHKDKNHE